MQLALQQRLSRLEAAFHELNLEEQRKIQSIQDHFRQTHVSIIAACASFFAFLVLRLGLQASYGQHRATVHRLDEQQRMEAPQQDCPNR